MNLEALSFECRQNVLDMIMEGRAGHIGGDFSVMDILITLYFKQMNIRLLYLSVRQKENV